MELRLQLKYMISRNNLFLKRCEIFWSINADRKGRVPQIKGGVEGSKADNQKPQVHKMQRISSSQHLLSTINYWYAKASYLFYLILTVTTQGGCYCYTHFTARDQGFRPIQIQGHSVYQLRWQNGDVTWSSETFPWLQIQVDIQRPSA